MEGIASRYLRIPEQSFGSSFLSPGLSLAKNEIQIEIGFDWWSVCPVFAEACTGCSDSFARWVWAKMLKRESWGPLAAGEAQLENNCFHLSVLTGPHWFAFLLDWRRFDGWRRLCCHHFVRFDCLDSRHSMAGNRGVLKPGYFHGRSTRGGHRFLTLAFLFRIQTGFAEILLSFIFPELLTADQDFCSFCLRSTATFGSTHSECTSAFRWVVRCSAVARSFLWVRFPSAEFAADKQPPAFQIRLVSLGAPVGLQKLPAQQAETLCWAFRQWSQKSWSKSCHSFMSDSDSQRSATEPSWSLKPTWSAWTSSSFHRPQSMIASTLPRLWWSY